MLMDKESDFKQGQTEFARHSSQPHGQKAAEEVQDVRKLEVLWVSH